MLQWQWNCCVLKEQAHIPKVLYPRSFISCYRTFGTILSLVLGGKQQFLSTEWINWFIISQVILHLLCLNIYKTPFVSKYQLYEKQITFLTFNHQRILR